MKKQSGFTLIELIMVIVILGILAATALPKFVDVSKDAKIAAVKGIAGGLSSADTINYGVAKVRGAASATPVTDCVDAKNLLDSAWPSEYTITAKSIASGVTETCTVYLTAESGVSATFNASNPG